MALEFFFGAWSDSTNCKAMAAAPIISVVASAGCAGQIRRAKPKFQSTMVPLMESARVVRKIRK